MDRYIIDRPELRGIMGRDAKRLRESIYEVAVLNGTAGMTELQIHNFHDAVIKEYDPVIWERPILYANSADISDTFKRMTSSLYQDQQRGGKKAFGNKAGPRRKNVDWLLVASKFPDEFWLPGIQNPRTGSIHPKDFDHIREQFTDIYKLFTGWLVSDFGYKTLFGIFDASKRYSISIIQECMGMVDDLRNRSYEYLMAIVDREMGIRKIEMMENKELLDRSKQILGMLVDMATNRSQSVDWDSIIKSAQMDAQNASEFDKVKNS